MHLVHFGIDRWYGKEFEKRKGILKSNKPYPCPKPWNQIAVEHDVIVLCSLDYKKVVKIGNILKNNIVDIWNNEVMKYIKKVKMISIN